MQGSWIADLLDPEFPLRLDLLLRLLLAAVLGGIIGLEREVSGKPAGFRTNLLICVGAALLTELSISIAATADPNATNADPGRIAAQIVSGIGFLGAGTILQARGAVIGLTTAATLWVVAAIGMAVGARAYVEAIGTTVLVFVALVVLARIEERIIRQRTDRVMQVSIEPEAEFVGRVEAVLHAAGLDDVRILEVAKDVDAYVVAFSATGRRNVWVGARDELLKTPGVRKVRQL